MSQPRFLADQNLNDQIVRGLLRREPSIDIIRARDVAMDRVTDDAVLEYAAGEGRIVISHDVNTMSAAATARIERGLRMSGVVLVAQDAQVSRVIEDLLMMWVAGGPDDWVNWVRFLPL